jgi:hypothetical protein
LAIRVQGGATKTKPTIIGADRLGVSTSKPLTL